MRILHVKNVAGVATQLRNAQRQLGHESDILVFGAGDKQYDHDYIWHNNRIGQFPTPIGEGVQLIKNFLQFIHLIAEYDVLHFHGYTIIGADVAPRRPPQGLDLPFWKLAGKTVIMHHHGSDIRYRGCPYLQKKFADLRLVSTPDLLEWDPEAELVLNPIFTDKYEFVGVNSLTSDDPITVVHAPTDREKKGTKHVIEAVQKLKNDGLNIDLKIVENTPHDEAIEIYKNADIIADQFKLGWYGMFCIESMAFGKPVLVAIDDNYKQYAPELPVIDTSPNEIAETIEMLANDYEYRAKIAKRSRDFVEQYHDAKVIANRIDGYISGSAKDIPSETGYIL